MRYLKVWKDDSGVKELTRGEAETLLKDWYPGIDDETIAEMLSKPGNWNCQFSWLEVVDD